MILFFFDKQNNLKPWAKFLLVKLLKHSVAVRFVLSLLPESSCCSMCPWARRVPHNPPARWLDGNACRVTEILLVFQATGSVANDFSFSLSFLNCYFCVQVGGEVQTCVKLLVFWWKLGLRLCTDWFYQQEPTKYKCHTSGFTKQFIFYYLLLLLLY